MADFQESLVIPDDTESNPSPVGPPTPPAEEVEADVNAMHDEMIAAHCAGERQQQQQEHQQQQQERQQQQQQQHQQLATVGWIADVWSF